MVNGILPFGKSCRDRKLLYVNIGSIDGGQLGWQAPDGRRLNAITINQARHFNATTRGQILNQAAIWDVAINARQFVRLDGFDNERCVLWLR